MRISDWSSDVCSSDRKGATGGFDGGLAKDRPVLEYDANSAIFLCECGQPWVHLAAEGTLIIGKNHQCEVIYFGLNSPRRRILSELRNHRVARFHEGFLAFLLRRHWDNPPPGPEHGPNNKNENTAR